MFCSPHSLCSLSLTHTVYALDTEHPRLLHLGKTLTKAPGPVVVWPPMPNLAILQITEDLQAFGASTMPTTESTLRTVYALGPGIIIRFKCNLTFYIALLLLLCTYEQLEVNGVFFCPSIWLS